MKYYVNNNKMYGNNSFTSWTNVQSKYPVLNIIESNENYIVEVELPGFTLEDVNLKLEKHILKISSKKIEKSVEEKDVEKKKYLFRERIKKEFSRSLYLGNDVDEEQLKAVLKNGLLTITLPKKEQVLPRFIDVKCV